MFLKTLFSPRPRSYTLLQPVHHSPTEFAMRTSKTDKVVTTATDGDGPAGNLDGDVRRLAEMGYTQDMQRNFSVISLLGVAFSLANSWFGISASLITGIKSGGTVLTIYGIPWIAFVSTCVGVTLSELASAMPNAGGQYFWASELSPKRYAAFASYLTGWLAWAGAIFTCASVALSLGSAGVGMWQLSHPDLYVFTPAKPRQTPI